MIPYEELVAALARWRARRGLPTGLGDYLGETRAGDFEMQPPVDHSRDDEVELGDESIEGVLSPAQGGAYAGQAEAAEGGRAGNGAGDFDGAAAGHMDFGAPGSEESTRPAGLAGLVDGIDGMDREPESRGETPPARDGAAPETPEDKPHPKGRSRRRRRK